MLDAIVAALDGFEIALHLDLRQQIGQQMEDAERTRLVAEAHGVALADWERAVELVKVVEPVARAVWVVCQAVTVV